MLLLALVESVVLVGCVLPLLVVGFLRLLVVSVRVGARLVRVSSWLLVWCWLSGAGLVLVVVLTVGVVFPTG